jgi:hypothetical protein
VLVAFAVALALPQGPVTDLCDSRVNVSPLLLPVLLADADEDTVQPPVDPLDTVASVSAETRFLPLPVAGMFASSADRVKIGTPTKARATAAALAAEVSRPVHSARDLLRDGAPRLPSIIVSSHKKVESRK